MSFRELRAFGETMKALGFPRVISLDSFRAPNFELVADCLHWLIHRFYPECSISDDIATESERVAFLQAVGAATLAKARTRLHLKRLYAADGSAVRELLKLASLLYRATQTAAAGADEEGGDVIDPLVSLKLLDAGAASAAAGEVARSGPALHDGLAAEAAQLREARARALAAAHDGSMVEAAINEALAGLSQGLASLHQQLSEAGASEAQLTARLDKWSGELERAEKRLATLVCVRPAYMDEYEAHTAQLQVLWLHYLERLRNLQYLEAQLDRYSRGEQDAADAAERRRRKMQRRLAEEELRILRGEQEVTQASLNTGARPCTTGGASGSGSGGSSDTEDSARSSRPQGACGNWPPGARSSGPASTARGGGWGSSSLQRQQQQQQERPGDGGTKVIGSLTAAPEWEDDEDSSIDDAATDGLLSHGGSADGGERGAVGGGWGAAGSAAEDEDDPAAFADDRCNALDVAGSDDSGF